MRVHAMLKKIVTYLSSFKIARLEIFQKYPCTLKINSLGTWFDAVYAQIKQYANAKTGAISNSCASSRKLFDIPFPFNRVAFRLIR